MSNDTILNPEEEFVKNIRLQIRDNNGYCLYCENRNSKANKCPKYCHKNADLCMCGIYIHSFDDSIH